MFLHILGKNGRPIFGVFFEHVIESRDSNHQSPRSRQSNIAHLVRLLSNRQRNEYKVDVNNAE